MRTSFTSQRPIDRTSAALWLVLMLLASLTVLARPVSAHSIGEHAVPGAHSQSTIAASDRAPSLQAPSHRRDGSSGDGNPDTPIAASPALIVLFDLVQPFDRIRDATADRRPSCFTQPRAPPSFTRLH